MLEQLLTGAVLVMLTVPIHGLGMAIGLKWVMYAYGHTRVLSGYLSQSLIIGILVLIMFVATVLEASLWAFAYESLNVVHSFEEALYFSLVTYTTVGYGDVVLAENWRVLSALQAANGVIVFGWTTAVILGGLRVVHRGANKARVKS